MKTIGFPGGRFITVGLPILVAVVFALEGGTAADTAHKRGKAGIRVFSRVLKEAGCPLTDAQMEEIKALAPGERSRERLMSILNEDQRKALENERERRLERARSGGKEGARGTGDGPNVRLRMVARVLERSGCPLTESQVERIRGLEPGPERRGRLVDILTGEQKDALARARKGMRKARGEGCENDRSERGTVRPRVRRLSRVLEEAGYPLTEAQLDEIRALEPGTDIRAGVMDILTPEQREALGNGFSGETAGIRGYRRITGVLEEAGCPLTDEQLESIRELPRGPGRKDSIRSVLTPEQLEALDRAFEGDGFEGLEKPAAAGEKPESFNLLKQNYPNPFNPATTIEYRLAEPGDVRVEVYSPGGQLVTTLVSGHQGAGEHSVVWDASSQAAGVYICKISAGDFSESIKMTLVK